MIPLLPRHLGGSQIRQMGTPPALMMERRVEGRGGGRRCGHVTEVAGRQSLGLGRKAGQVDGVPA
jgi:hypothetical protein